MPEKAAALNEDGLDYKTWAEQQLRAKNLEIYLETGGDYQASYDDGRIARIGRSRFVCSKCGHDGVRMPYAVRVPCRW